MTSLCTTYWQLFLAQGVGMGISMGLIVQVCLSIPSQWFKKRRAGAMGILASSAGLGATVQPIYVKKVIPIVGFAWTMRIMAFACAIAFTGCFFLIKTRVTPRPSTVKASKYWIDLEAFKRKSYTLFVIGAFFIMCESLCHLSLYGKIKLTIRVASFSCSGFVCSPDIYEHLYGSISYPWRWILVECFKCIQHLGSTFAWFLGRSIW